MARTNRPNQWLGAARSQNILDRTKNIAPYRHKKPLQTSIARPAISRQKLDPMEQFEAEAVVIGAGVVGLAVARALQLAGHDTVVLEKNNHIGMETSARNSEVIHAGIYYPQGSLKARLCVRGKAMLYDFCAAHGVPHRRLGKLIVGHAGQETLIAAIAKAATGNGVDDLRPLGAREIASLEPDVTATQGLFSPSTGIIDSHQYMLALLGDLTLVKGSEVIAIRRNGEAWSLQVRNDGEDMVLNTRLLVNAAGLWAERVARRIEGLNNIAVLHLAKGNYASLSVKSPFTHLVYPVPEPGGLGVHVTLDMGGRARFGPNVEWLASGDPGADRLYRVARHRRPVRAGDRALLAGHPGRDADAGLFRGAAQTVGAGRGECRFPHRRSGRTWPSRSGQPVRDRIAGAHRLPRHRRACGRAIGLVSWFRSSPRHGYRASPSELRNQNDTGNQ